MTPLIEIDRVAKRFGPVTALEGVSLGIAAGEFFALLGPSGCGKTTLLRILAGIETPTAGRVRIDGQDMTGVPPNRRPTNMVFQSYAIFPHLSVAENVGYGLRYQGVRGAAAAARVEEALAMVQMRGLGGRAAHQLSGGQRQRVALARALVLRPKVLLLDEPLSALDKKLREEMQVELRALQAGLGITFVFVTHDQDEALALSDRIAVMEGGRILQTDTPEGLYLRPSDARVAGFFGTMNLIPGTVTDPGGPGPAELDGGPFGRLRGLPGPGLAAGAAAVAAVRPERLRIGGAPGAGANRLAARVSARTFLGDRSLVHLRAAADGRALVALVAHAGGAAAPPEPGAEVTLWWEAASGLILSA